MLEAKFCDANKHYNPSLLAYFFKDAYQLYIAEEPFE